MAKKRGGGGGGQKSSSSSRARFTAAGGGGRRLAASPPPNPFESFGRIRKKHDVLGKRTKAGPALTQARSEAVERVSGVGAGGRKRTGRHHMRGASLFFFPLPSQSSPLFIPQRKRTLLVEYRSAARANAFIDRRFGEDDPGLGEEDKALLRLQSQRLRESGGGGGGGGGGKSGGRSAFALPDAGADAGLTHLGRSLADDGWGGGGIAAPSDSEDERGGALGADFVRAAHFGGGGGEGGDFEVHEQRGRAAAAGDPPSTHPHRKAKAEVMAELMAKSKAHKAARQAERADDADAAAALDTAFAALAATGALAGLLRPPGERGAAPEKEGADAAYDRARAAMLAAPGRAAPERPRPAEPANARRARAAGGGEEGEEEEGGAPGGGAGGESEDDFVGGALAAAAAGGGYAGRRARRALASLRGEAIAAAGGGRATGGGGGGDDDGEEGGSEEEEEESGSGSDGDGGAPALTGPAARAAARAAAATEAAHPLQLAANAALAELAAKHGLGTKKAAAAEVGGDGSEGGSEQEEATSSDEEGGAAAAPPPPRTPAAKPTPPAADGPLSYAAFLGAVADADAAAFPGAIAGLRCARKGAPAAAAGRAGAQALVAHLARFYGAVAARAPHLPVPLLDAVGAEFVAVASDVPFYAAAVARARLGRARARLAAGLRGGWGGGEGGGQKTASPPPPLSPWPDARDAALLRLWVAAFPPPRPPPGALAPGAVARVYGGPNAPPPPRPPGAAASGPVAGPAAALGAAYLSLCPLASRRDVGLCLLVGNTLADAADAFVPGPAWCPEALGAATAIVAGAAGHGGEDTGAGGGRWDLSAGAWPAPTAPAWAACSPRKKGAAAPPPPLSLGRVLAPEGRDEAGVRASPSLDADPAFPASALGAAFALMARCAQSVSGAPAAPAALAPAAAALAALGATAALPAGLEAARAAASTAVAAAATATTATRGPLSRMRATSASALPAGAQTLNPRFEAAPGDGGGWAPGKDFDPDRERAAARHLRRSIARETRGAMRELRKDSAFISGARGADADAAKAERKAAARAGRSFMEAQAADAASGGQRGNWKRKRD